LRNVEMSDTDETGLRRLIDAERVSQEGRVNALNDQ